MGEQKIGFLPVKGAGLANSSAPIQDYRLPGLARYRSAATAAAGVVGTVAVFGVGLVLARAFTRGEAKPARHREGIAPDAI